MKLISDSTLSHYGIPGQKWGTRRWQYPDGRFNEEGKIRPIQRERFPKL